MRDASANPTSGTAATSSPVSELGSFFSAVDNSSHGIASSTAVYASNGFHRDGRGWRSPRANRDGRRTAARFPCG